MKKAITILSVLTVTFFGIYFAQAYDLPRWFPFNEESALDEWQEKVFKNKVLYTVEAKDDEGYLLARSEEASSGIYHKMKFNLKEFPMMSWQWKVNQFPEKVINTESGEGWLEKDDYAARVYVIFSGWNFFNIKSLEYIWDEEMEEGSIITSPYMDNIKLIVVESGRENMRKWVFEERNILEDYKKAFGKKPPRNVGAIALMTDSDNSSSVSEALYKEIKVGYKDEPTEKH